MAGYRTRSTGIHTHAIGTAGAQPLIMTMIDSLLLSATLLECSGRGCDLDDPDVDRLITFWLRRCRVRAVA